jgi:dihydroorotate dehydrogenase (NAD+) catalytic subunit
VPLVVSVAGFGHDEFAQLVEGVAARDEVAALELNVSCPNVKSGCVMGDDPRETAGLMERVRPLTAKPLIVKLTPNASDIGGVALAAEQGGADALSLINTLRARPVDPASGRGWLGGGSGGLSGPAVRAIALEQVHAVASRTALPVVGMGGIQCGRDALDFAAAGATCVAVGTESFRDPAAGERVREELAQLLSKCGLARFGDVARVP